MSPVSIRDRFFGSLIGGPQQRFSGRCHRCAHRSRRSSPSEPADDLSSAMTLSGMRRLIDSDRSPASSLLISHPCNYTRSRSVGAFSSVRRAGRLLIANGHAENRASDIHQGPLGCRGTNLSTFTTRVQARRVMNLQPPVPAFSDPERVRSRSTRCCGSARRGIAARPVWTAPTGDSSMGVPWQQTGTPMGSWTKAT